MKSKVALQQVGAAPPPVNTVVSIAGRIPVELLEVTDRSQAETVPRSRAIVTAEQADHNMRLDEKAAETDSALPANGETSAVDHVMNSAESNVSDEGMNLLETSAPTQASQPAEP